MEILTLFQAYCDYEICRCEEGYEARYGSCFKTIEDFQVQFENTSEFSNLLFLSKLNCNDLSLLLAAA